MKQFIPGLLFSNTSVGKEAREAVRTLPPGGVLLLENLRRNAGETKNSPEFAAELAELADVFVQDAFDNCHRKHASMIGVPKLLPSYAGFTLMKEAEELGEALHPGSPSLAVISGVKFSTKEPVLTQLLSIYDHVFVGGALANDFIQANGHDVGASTVSGSDAAPLKQLLSNPKLLTPLDAVVAPVGSARTEGRIASLDDVRHNEAILDIGPRTVEMLATLAVAAKSIVWNGPLGLFEHGFTDGTYALARAIAESDAHSVVGGGDTIAAIEKLDASSKFSFISTGGGAMLDFLADGTLPGIAVLDNKSF